MWHVEGGLKWLLRTFYTSPLTPSPCHGWHNNLLIFGFLSHGSRYTVPPYMSHLISQPLRPRHAKSKFFISFFIFFLFTATFLDRFGFLSHSSWDIVPLTIQKGTETKSTTTNCSVKRPQPRPNNDERGPRREWAAECMKKTQLTVYHHLRYVFLFICFTNDYLHFGMSTTSETATSHDSHT